MASTISCTKTTVAAQPARLAGRAARGVAPRPAISSPLRARLSAGPAARRLAASRRAPSGARAAVGEGQGGLEMVTLTSGDTVAEVRHAAAASPQPLLCPVSQSPTNTKRAFRSILPPRPTNPLTKALDAEIVFTLESLTLEDVPSRVTT